jgi:hypothetical protein
MFSSAPQRHCELLRSNPATRIPAGLKGDDQHN